MTSSLAGQSQKTPRKYSNHKFQKEQKNSIQRHASLGIFISGIFVLCMMLIAYTVLEAQANRIEIVINMFWLLVIIPALGFGFVGQRVLVKRFGK